MRDDREIRLKVYLGLYVLMLYVMCYFVLYTYSFLGIDLLFPFHIFVYGGLLIGFLVLYHKYQVRLSDGYNKVLIIVLSLLPIMIVTSMFQSPMTAGSVLGAENGFQDLGRYLERVPWAIFKDYEVSLLYVKIPSLISLGSAITIFFVKKRKVLAVIPLFIFFFILALIPYLLWAETFIDCGH